MKKLTIAIVAIAVIIAGGAFYYVGYGKPETGSNDQNIQEITSSATYICAESKAFSVGFADGIAQVLLENSKFTLEQATSASGSKYSNDGDAIVFWSKGETAFVEEGGRETYSECVLLTTAGGEMEILEASVNEKITAKGVSITPLEVLEDSRCPIDVVCIQAGTIRLRTKLSSSLGEAEQIFKLNESVTTEAEEITLVRVLPAARSSEQIESADYRFYFEIQKR